MKKTRFSFIGLGLAMLMFTMLVAIQGCNFMGQELKPLSEMTPQEKVTMAYGTYNSQYIQHMTMTGWELKDGTWEKVNDPVLSDDQKTMLNNKKKILTQMWPLIKLYDNMTLGLAPYSAETETQLFNLIDELVLLVPG